MKVLEDATRVGSKKNQQGYETAWGVFVTLATSVMATTRGQAVIMSTVTAEVSADRK